MMFSIPSLLAVLVFQVALVRGFPQDYVDSGSDSSSSPRENGGDPRTCAQALIDWCQKQQFSGGSYISTSSYSSQLQTMVSCIADSTDGQACFKNSRPWFQCYPNNTLTYKGNVLNVGQVEADEELCAAKDLASRFIFRGVAGSFNDPAFNSHMKDFHNRMREFEESMDQMRRNLQQSLGGMRNNFAGMFQ